MVLFFNENIALPRFKTLAGLYFLRLSHVRDAAGGDEGAGASEERTSTEAKRTPKQPDPGDFRIG